MIKDVAKVVIIGGGASGLAAAKHLYSHGMKDIKILEAQNYLGGRILTEDHGGKPIEHGAQFIDGEEGNVLYDIAKDLNAINEEKELNQMGNTLFVREDGEKIGEETVEKFRTLMSGINEDSEKDFADCRGSVGEYYSRRFSSLNEWGELGLELLDWQDRFMSTVDGANSWYESSAIGQLTYKECPGNPIGNWRNGFDTLIKYYEKIVPSSLISLDTPVRRVNWGTSENMPKNKEETLRSQTASTSRKYSRSSEGATNSYNVMLDLINGEKVLCNHVIVTTSLGVLKSEGKDLFSPSLPSDKLKAIEGLDIGAVDKIYFEFPQKWWPEDCNGFSILHSIVGNTNVKSPWSRKLLGFYDVNQHPNMLCGWISGKAAKEMENETLETVTEICIDLLRKYLRNHYVIPDPIWSKKTSWFMNPYTKGSYSFRSLKSEEMNVWQKDLAQPLCNDEGLPIVCFAGEATHDCFYSTVHGAIEAGTREAERILQSMKRDGSDMM